jgi:hypothetical protein
MFMPTSITVFKKFFATRSEDASQMMPATPTEETLDPLTEVDNLALFQSQYHHILLTDYGHYNGHGLEELLL